MNEVYEDMLAGLVKAAGELFFGKKKGQGQEVLSMYKKAIPLLAGEIVKAYADYNLANERWGDKEQPPTWFFERKDAIEQYMKTGRHSSIVDVFPLRAIVPWQLKTVRKNLKLRQKVFHPVIKTIDKVEFLLFKLPSDSPEITEEGPLEGRCGFTAAIPISFMALQRSPAKMAEFIYDTFDINILDG